MGLRLAKHFQRCTVYRLCFSAMWLVEGNFYPESNDAWEIGQMSSDPLLSGGVWAQDYIYLVNARLMMTSRAHKNGRLE